MSDEHDAARATERPVEPPVIDVEAAEVAEEPVVAAAEAAVAEEPPVIDVEAEDAGEEPAPQPIAEPDNTVERRASGGAGSGRLWLAAGVAVAVAGAALWWLSYSGFRLARDDGRIAALTQRIEVLETTFGATRGEVAELAGREAENKASLDKVASQPPQGLDEINSRMAAIESALQSAQAAIEAAGKASGSAAGGGEVVALTGRIDELQQKLAALEKANSAASEAQQAQAMKGSELAAALAGLDAPLAAGQPFTAELDKVAAVSPTLTGIEELRPHAATGAPSVADLTLRLQAIADRETGTPTASPAVGEQGLWTGLRSKISGLVTVRDLAEARWIDGTAAAAQAAAKGDIAEAVAILQAIDGPPPEELRVWLAEAQARLAVDRAAKTMAEAARQEAPGSP